MAIIPKILQTLASLFGFLTSIIVFRCERAFFFFISDARNTFTSFYHLPSDEKVKTAKPRMTVNVISGSKRKRRSDGKFFLLSIFRDENLQEKTE